MQNWEWKREYLFKPNYKSNTSDRLAQFHSKLISCKKTSSQISIPSYQALKTQLRVQGSPSRFEKPRFDHYSDIASFRSISPKNKVSPTWRTRAKHQSIFSNISGSPTPRSSMNLQVVRIEELKKAIQLISEMNKDEMLEIPRDYASELYEFSKIVRSKIK